MTRSGAMVHALVSILGSAALVCIALRCQAAASPPGQLTDPRIEISVPSSIATPLTGRLVLFITRRGEREPRLAHYGDALMFGVDVQSLKPGDFAHIDARVPGFPLTSLRDIPPGDYFVQGLLNVYTQVTRADGHTIWVHFDQGEGQNPPRSPGNLYSEVQKVHLDPKVGYRVQLALTKVIPPIAAPADTPWVKHLKIQSALLTRFWGHPMYLGATILLPKGYAEHPNSQYPVIYLQGHFNPKAPLGFSTDPSRTHGCKPQSVRLGRKLNVPDPAEDCDDPGGELAMPESAVEFYQSWNGDHFPRMIAVTFQHATPYYDDSYAVNSANNGPCGDAIMTELIPAIEEQFRIIRAPYARLLAGGSTGGWEALALQVYHPNFFGGAWSFAPDPVDFRRWLNLDIYHDDNAYSVQYRDWLSIERPNSRTSEGQPIDTNRDDARMESVWGSKGRSGRDEDNWGAVYGPADAEGYPKPLWDRHTGKIDHTVANYMKEHGYDLRAYLEGRWHEIGAQLVGKLHVICGDDDDYFLNLAVYKLEDFLENTRDPYYAGSFEYGRPMRGHGWQPTTHARLIRQMAKEIIEHSHSNTDAGLWNY